MTEQTFSDPNPNLEVDETSAPEHAPAEHPSNSTGSGSAFGNGAVDDNDQEEEEVEAVEIEAPDRHRLASENWFDYLRSTVKADTLTPDETTCLNLCLRKAIENAAHHFCSLALHAESVTTAKNPADVFLNGARVSSVDDLDQKRGLGLLSGVSLTIRWSSKATEMNTAKRRSKQQDTPGLPDHLKFFQGAKDAKGKGMEVGLCYFKSSPDTGSIGSIDLYKIEVIKTWLKKPENLERLKKMEMESHETLLQELFDMATDEIREPCQMLTIFHTFPDNFELMGNLSLEPLEKLGLEVTVNGYFDPSNYVPKRQKNQVPSVQGNPKPPPRKKTVVIPFEDREEKLRARLVTVPAEKKAEQSLDVYMTNICNMKDMPINMSSKLKLAAVKTLLDDCIARYESSIRNSDSLPANVHCIKWAITCREEEIEDWLNTRGTEFCTDSFRDINEELMTVFTRYMYDTSKDADLGPFMTYVKTAGYYLLLAVKDISAIEDLCKNAVLPEATEPLPSDAQSYFDHWHGLSLGVCSEEVASDELKLVQNCPVRLKEMCSYCFLYAKYIRYKKVPFNLDLLKALLGWLMDKHLSRCLKRETFWFLLDMRAHCDSTEPGFSEEAKFRILRFFEHYLEFAADKTRKVSRFMVRSEITSADMRTFQDPGADSKRAGKKRRRVIEPKDSEKPDDP